MFYEPLSQWRSADKAVVAAALKAAKDFGADRMMTMALIEAGIVESNLQNLHYGDRDSVGFLQQRPSAGWGTVAQCEDPYHAAMSFLERAKHFRPRARRSGQLAQLVQVSAYPLRYSLAHAAAAYVIRRASA